MVKKCKVVANNEAVTVVEFGEEELIQFPAMGYKAKYVWVKENNGDYVIVDSAENMEEEAKEKPVVKPDWLREEDVNGENAKAAAKKRQSKSKAKVEKTDEKTEEIKDEDIPFCF